MSARFPSPPGCIRATSLSLSVRGLITQDLHIWPWLSKPKDFPKLPLPSAQAAAYTCYVSTPHCEPLSWLASRPPTFSPSLYIKTQPPQSPAWGWLYLTHSRISSPLYMSTLPASRFIILQQVTLCGLTVILEDPRPHQTQQTKWGRVQMVGPARCQPGRLLLRGLEDPELLVAMFTFLSHLSPLLPHPHLLSFPSSPKNWLGAVHRGCSLLRTSSTEFLPGFSSGGGWGCDSVAWGRMGEGLSELGARQGL